MYVYGSCLDDRFKSASIINRYLLSLSALQQIPHRAARSKPDESEARTTAAAAAAVDPPLPILLCGDFNARPPPLEGREEEEDYPAEAVPIVLAGGEGTGAEEGGGLRFESCYDLKECVFRGRKWDAW